MVIEKYKMLTKIQDMQDNINELTKELKSIKQEFIDTFCPYKINDKIIYREWWRHKDYKSNGIIIDIDFVETYGIEGHYRLTVQPCTIKWNKKPRNHPVYLGNKSADDTILKVVK